jgi:hypothetical protein
MKRSALISIFAIASLGLASQASAIHVFVANPSATTLNIGDTFSVEYRLDTEGETQMTSIFVSLFGDPSIFRFEKDLSSAQNAILVNLSTFANLGLAVGPTTDPGDPPGQVRAANFVTSNPAGSGVSNANQLMATVVFTAVGNGVAPIQALVEVGSDEVTVAQVSVTGSVTSSDSVDITVPEPGAAALTMVAIGTVALIRRRTASV